MISTRRLLSLFRIGFLLSFARVLNNNPVITETNVLALSHDMPNIDNAPIPSESLNFFTALLNAPDNTEQAFTISTKTYLAGLSTTELPLIFQQSFEKKAFKDLLFMLVAANTPEKELHGFAFIIRQLMTTHTEQEEASLLLCFCHFIEDFHPSTDLGEQAKATLVREIALRVPDLEKAILDYHVLNRNFKKAAKHLHSEVSESYRETVQRLSLKVETPDDLLGLTLVDLLAQVQIKNEPLPLTHPVLASALKNMTDTDTLLFEIKFLFSPIDEIEKMNGQAGALLPSSDKHLSKFTSTDAEKTVTAQENIPDNLVLKKNFKIIATLAAIGAERRQDYKEAVRQLIISYLPDENFKEKSAYNKLFNIMRTPNAQLGISEMCLLLRFLISNIDDIDKDKQPSILYGYETFILDKKAMMEMPQAYASLFLVYGKAEEQLIRKHYPEEIANKIIEIERALPVKNTTNYYSYIPLAMLGGLGGWAHASHNAAKRAKKRVEATPKKMEAPQADAKTPATITEKEITLSDIILGAIADLLDKAPKDCPAINAIDENNPLSLKKTFTFPASEHNGKTVDVRNPDRLIKNLIQFHEQQQEAFNKARGLPGVRKAEAFNVIKTKCRRLVAKHLISTEESTLKIQTRVVLTPKEKIEHLLGNEKFPLEARKPWVKLPTATYDDLLDATQNHGSDPQIKTQLTLLETTNQLLEEKKSQLNGLKKDYLSLSADYDAALNPNDVDLIRFCEKISSLQAECRPLLTDIASHVKQYELLVTSIQKRHDQLIKSETPPQETQEEHDARVQRIRDEKKRKKVEAEAKAQADIEKQAREKEIDQKRRAEREQENKDRQKNAWLTRWEKTNDPKIMGALLYANTALLILNDVVNAKIKDDDYLRDACILSCTQLYEALKDLSQTVFSELLPNTETLAQYRNAFAHVAMFSDFTPNDWKRMAHDTYQHFFAFVDAYHRVKTYGDPIYIHAMPALHFLMPDNINERDQFRNLCQRYLTLKEKLSTALNDEKTLYQHEAINLLSIAMRSLVMQIDDMGNRIGLNAANKNMQLLAIVRNEEAHNGVRADKATLINLSTPIRALLRTIKPENKPAKPSQVGLYQDNKKHPSPPSPFSQRTLK